jgi:RHS repeat-associated protein
VRGEAAANATVLVNDEPTSRAGDQFYGAVPVLGAKENMIKIQAATASPHYVVTEDRAVLVPTVPESFQYDADGNLTQDGLWNYEWDGENRLKAQELRSDLGASKWTRLEYAYDGQGRRVRKVVKTKTSAAGTWATTSDTRFLYDGWNLLAEFDCNAGTFALSRSHAWGIDLSGSSQGAGGVGGLLWTNVATAKTYAAGSDANGNVMLYVDCADGTVAGRRDYAAFGEAVMTTGVAASLPFGFSTKYEEKESGLYYYGFRYYNPSTGRWLSRDPIEERGGLSLYGVVENDTVNHIDRLGLWRVEFQRAPGNFDGHADHLTVEAHLMSGATGAQYDPDHSGAPNIGYPVISVAQGWGDGSRAPSSPPAAASTTNSISIGVFGATNFNRWEGAPLHDIQWSGELMYDVYLTPENNESQVCNMAFTVDSSFFLHMDAGVNHSPGGGSRSYLTISEGPNKGKNVGKFLNPFTSYGIMDFGTNQSGPFPLSGRTRVARIFVGHQWQQYGGDSIVTNAQTKVTVDAR